MKEFSQGLAAGLIHDGLPEGVSLFRRGGGQGPGHTAAAGHDSLVEQTFAQGGENVLLNAHGAGTLAHDGDVFGVAAEGSDVVFHPFHGGDLVIQAIVAGETGLLLQLGQAKEAHGS